ncbi:lamin tail domain-containing protein [Panacagrimonas sp.]|uniref:lamin tail domain-containing protein n=1 Tax=Panacagrimonas sp. TaxID=2480088 RepID=UPI003B518A58
MFRKTRLAAAAALFAVSVPTALAAPLGVVISEFRVEGVNGNDEFVELLNTGSAAVDIGGWSLQGCAAGSGAASNRTTIPTGTLLSAGMRYLFANSNGPDAALIGMADRTYGTGFANSGNSGIRILGTGSMVQDGLGIGAGVCVEGTALNALGGTSGTQSYRRLAAGGQEESQDTDNNVADFEGPVAASPGTAPQPVAELPFARIAEIQGMQHRSPLEGQSVRTRGVVTSVFQLSASNKGFYIQDPDGDGIDATSEGIQIFVGGAAMPAVSVGDEVSVRGLVTEFRPGGNSTQNLTITELTGPMVMLESDTIFINPLTPTVIGQAGRVPPNTVVDDDTVGGDVEDAGNTIFDPANDGVDFYESLEGMWVQIDDGLVTGPTNAFGEVFVLPDGGAGASGLNLRGGITLTHDANGVVDYNPERIQIDDEYFRAAHGDMPAAKVGDTASVIQGVVTYNFGNFEVLPSVIPSFTDGGLQREVSEVSVGEDRLTIANYNVENLDINDDDICNGSPDDNDVADGRFTSVAQQVVINLGSPDILALQEVQDDSGCTNDGTVVATQTLALMVDEIVAAGGPEYTAVEIAPVDNAEGGQPSGNIRVAYLYNAARVSLVPGMLGAGGSLDATSATLDGDGELALTFSPGRVDPTNAAWAATRVSLAAVFEFNGQRIVTVNNHWSSKGGSSPILGRTQPFVNGSEDDRSAQAVVVKTFVDDVLATQADARLAVLGDINEFTFNRPMRILTGATLPGATPAQDSEGTPVLFDLGDALIAEQEERYSYVFEGNAQALDHILVSAALLAPEVQAEFDAVHINAEFPDQLSDHDPDIASFLLVDAPVELVCVAGPGDHLIDRRNARLPQIITGRANQRNVIFGSRFADLITGGRKDDCIDGGAGPDLILGLNGDDVLIGGEGVDSLFGTAGDDTLDGGPGRDIVNGGAGDNTCVAGEGDLQRQCD